MVKSFGSRIVFADEYCRACCRSNAFNFHTTVTVQILRFYFFQRSFLIDSKIQNKQEKQIKFPRQPEQGKLFRLSNFARHPVALSVNLFHLTGFPGYAVWGC